MLAAAATVDVLLDAAAIGEDADAVARVEGNLRQRKCRVYRIIEFREVHWLARLFNLSSQEASRVDDDPDDLPAFEFEGAGDQLVATGSGGPGNIAEIVTAAIFAKTLEFTTQAAMSPHTAFHFHLAAANEEQGVLLGPFDIGKNADGLRGFSDGPAFGETQDALITEEGSAEAGISAGGWEN